MRFVRSVLCGFGHVEITGGSNQQFAAQRLRKQTLRPHRVSDGCNSLHWLRFLRPNF